MSLLIPPRSPSEEILDDPSLSSAEMERSLQDLWLVNRSWGGASAIERFIREASAREGRRQLIVLDVGAGSGHVARQLGRSLREGGFEAKVIANDLQWRHLAAGRRMMRGELPPALCADAFALPLRDGSVDWVVSTLLLHHFSPEDNERLLEQLARIGRVGFALLDLRRHVFPLLFVGLAGKLVFRSRISVEDGKASVKQAYTPEEARAFASRAAAGTRVDRVFPFRMLLSRRTL